MLIHRARYLDDQEHWEGNEMLIQAWQIDILRLERRAADRHGRILKRIHHLGIENDPTCSLCGHIECKGECRANPS